MLGSAAGKVIFDTAQLRPSAGSTAASADDLKNARRLRTQTEAATLAYLVLPINSVQQVAD